MADLFFLVTFGAEPSVAFVLRMCDQRAACTATTYEAHMHSSSSDVYVAFSLYDYRSMYDS